MLTAVFISVVALNPEPMLFRTFPVSGPLGPFLETADGGGFEDSK